MRTERQRKKEEEEEYYTEEQGDKEKKEKEKWIEPQRASFDMGRNLKRIKEEERAREVLGKRMADNI